MGMFSWVDTLQNLMSGLHTGKDKASHDKWMFSPVLQDEIENAYDFDWLTKKLINIPAEDSTKKWRRWQASGPQIEKIEATEKRLMVQQKVMRAMQLARLDGGAALFLGTGDADVASPLDIESIGLDGLKYLHIMRRIDLKPTDIERDPLLVNYGEPTSYQIATATPRSGAIEIHPSRIVRFIGDPPIDPMRGDHQGWGLSILQSVNLALKNAAMSSQAVAAALHELKIDIISVPGLSKLLSTEEGTSRVTDRFAHANMMKSMFNMVLMGDGEEFGRKEINFSAMPQVVQLFLQIASGAADIPITRLLGQSPSGMNATGESDTRNYYDMLSSRQKLVISPAMTNLDELIIRSSTGSRAKSIYYEWAPLWELSETEKAAIAKVKAETSQIYQKTNVFLPEVFQAIVTNQLIEDNTYPGIEAAIKEFGINEDPVPTVAAPLAGEKNPEDPAITDAAPKTLYVSREVENSAEIIAWARKQGIKDIADDLHVTIMFSRTPVDWMKAGSDLWEEKDGHFDIAPGGPRDTEFFGDNSVVITFANNRLSWRHMDLLRAGCESDYDYQPHITVSKNRDGIDLSKIEPYRGPIKLGIEKFEEVKE